MKLTMSIFKWVKSSEDMNDFDPHTQLFPAFLKFIRIIG